MRRSPHRHESGAAPRTALCMTDCLPFGQQYYLYYVTARSILRFRKWSLIFRMFHTPVLHLGAPSAFHYSDPASRFIGCLQISARSFYRVCMCFLNRERIVFQWRRAAHCTRSFKNWKDGHRSGYPSYDELRLRRELDADAHRRRSYWGQFHE